MQGQEIQNKFPKSWKKLTQWCIDGLESQRKAYLDRLPPDVRNGIEIPEITATDEQIRAMIDVYTRRLYDFFDDNGIWIQVKGTDAIWRAYPLCVSKEHPGAYEQTHETDSSNRQNAETQAFMSAFEILEGKL